MFLLKSSFDASAMEDSALRVQILEHAHRRLRLCSINFANVVKCVTALSKKPLLLDAQVCM